MARNGNVSDDKALSLQRCSNVMLRLANRLTNPSQFDFDWSNEFEDLLVGLSIYKLESLADCIGKLNREKNEGT